MNNSNFIQIGDYLRVVPFTVEAIEQSSTLTNKCTLHTSGGHKFAVNRTAEDVADLIDFAFEANTQYVEIESDSTD